MGASLFIYQWVFPIVLLGGEYLRLPFKDFTQFYSIRRQSDRCIIYLFNMLLVQCNMDSTSFVKRPK